MQDLEIPIILKEPQELLTRQPILLFDGECALCNKLIFFYLKREKNNKLNFAPLASQAGQTLLAYFEIDKHTDSIILIKNHDAFIKSCAVLRLCLYMKGIWPLMLIFLIIPPFIRNIPYDIIAKRRVKWFGKNASCALLQDQDQKRFIK